LVTRISQKYYALIVLHERCIVLLKATHEEFREEIVEKEGKELHWGRGNRPVVLYWIFKMMSSREVVLPGLKAMESFHQGGR
jgi:hypothetical protein